MLRQVFQKDNVPFPGSCFGRLQHGMIVIIVHRFGDVDHLRLPVNIAVLQRQGFSPPASGIKQKVRKKAERFLYALLYDGDLPDQKEAPGTIWAGFWRPDILRRILLQIALQHGIGKD